MYILLYPLCPAVPYRCPSFNPHISSFILLFYPFYPAILSPLSCYFIPFILTFILLVIRPGSRLIRLVVACCLIRPSFACPAQQQGKPLCFYFPDPRCGHRRLRARARRRSGTGPRCCPRRRRVSAGAGAWAGAGRGEGGGGWGMRASVASAGQERRRLRARLRERGEGKEVKVGGGGQASDGPPPLGPCKLISLLTQTFSS